MSDQADVLLKRAITKAEWKLGLVKREDNYEDSRSLSPYKKQIARTVFEKKEQIDNTLSIDAIYFSGEFPFIYFKQLTSYDPNIVRNLHRKIWNEGKAPLLAINTPKEIIFYDCFDVPRKNGDELNPVDYFFDAETDLTRLGELLHQSIIDSGTIWKTGQLGKKLKIQNRVDRKLVNNLSDARDVLHNKFKIPFSIVHDLLGRSLFALYLEDRGIYPSIDSKEEKFFALLNTPDNVYRRFNYLKEKLNGDLFPVSQQEKKLIKESKKRNDIFQIVNDCFYGNDVVTQQQALWSMFQFQYIPIELISSIYEEFMSEEDRGEIRKEGAYYTPPMLVDFVLNEVLPWPDENNKRYDLKILDPACGSGIFLVESYKRLIARWKYANNKTDVTKEVLEGLLLNSIYGIEKNPDAIKVAAFSLYLTMLNYTNPREVLSNVKFFKPLVRWSDEKELAERQDKYPGNNLFQSNTFDENLGVFEAKYDIVTGNPPWKLGKPDNTVKGYLSKHDLPKQIMCAYLHKMSSIAPREKIALVSTAKILFNTGEGYERFRSNLFSKNNVEAIINFSVVRDVLFTNAKAPAAVIIYKARNMEKDIERKDSVVYCVPKSIETIRNRQAIVIDASEIKYIPLREILKKDSRVFKIAMWGNARDLRIIERFEKYKTLKDAVPASNRATALHKAGKVRGNIHLKNYLYVSTKNITQFYVSPKGLKPLGDRHKYFRPNDKDIFVAPIVIVKEGTENGNICAAYVNFNCAYKAAALGIKLQNYTQVYHKALTVFLNSSFAHYYIFLTSSSWGIDKAGRNQNNAVLDLPAVLFEMSSDLIKQLSHKLDVIIKIKKRFMLSDNAILENIREEIDEIVYKGLNISEKEKALISDVLNFSVSLRNRYKASHAENSVGNLNTYTKALTETMNSLLKYNGKQVWPEILETNNIRTPLKAIVLHFDGKKESSSNNKLDTVLSEINKSVYEKHSESVYYRKVIKYYKSNCIYLIKPNQKRFWSISQALNDADELLLEFMNQ